MIEETSGKEITLDLKEILTLEIEMMVQAIGTVLSVIILISLEEQSVIDVESHAPEAAEEILEIAGIVDVETLEEEEAIVETVEITVEEILEIIGKGMEEEIPVKRLPITIGIAPNVKIPTSHLEPNVIDVGSHVRKEAEEILETVEMAAVETLEEIEATIETAEIGEEEILTEIVETMKEGSLKGMIQGTTKKSQSKIIFEKLGEKDRAMPIITLLNPSSLENLKEIEMIK